MYEAKNFSKSKLFLVTQRCTRHCFVYQAKRNWHVHRFSAFKLAFSFAFKWICTVNFDHLHCITEIFLLCCYRLKFFVQMSIDGCVSRRNVTLCCVLFAEQVRLMGQPLHQASMPPPPPQPFIRPPYFGAGKPLRWVLSYISVSVKEMLIILLTSDSFMCRNQWIVLSCHFWYFMADTIAYHRK